jgi:hypothetical protein
MINWILIIMATSLPAGYIIAYFCKDELVAGRKWFISLMIISLILILIFLAVYRYASIILTLAYIFVVSLINLILSHEKRFVK